MKAKSFEDMYYTELRDLMDAENRILKALPKVAQNSSSPELREAFNEHLEKSKGHVERLRQIFEGMGKSASGKTCDGIKGIITEGSEVLEWEDGPLKDAGLIGGAQRIEHYEIAAYGTVRTWAEMLGRKQDAQLLKQTLDEEKEADHKLTEIAERSTNVQAQQVVHS